MCEQMAVAGIASRQDTIKHVDAAAHRFHDVFGRAHPHQIARVSLGHNAPQEVQDAPTVLRRLPDRQATHGVAVEPDPHQSFQRGGP